MIILTHPKYLLLTLLFVSSSLFGWTQSRSFVVDTATQNIDGSYAPWDHIQPGDTLFFQTGRRGYILLQNIHGEAGNPVTFINLPGVVVINTSHYFGISIRNCSYFRFTGSGDPENFYGFRIENVDIGNGVGVGSLSTDFELDHLSIKNTNGTGITAKSDPDCLFNSTRDKFTQYNTSIHDNYIGFVAHEGLYIGSTKIEGQIIQCDGRDTLLFPHLLKGVSIYNNIIEHTGWDGLQVCSASEGCTVNDNIVMYDSEEGFYNQMSGIMTGGGSKCDCFNNLISHGKGNGIENHGLGGVKIYNNIIENAGRGFEPNDPMQMRHGIYIHNEGLPDSSFVILFNDIISPKSDGIRFDNTHSKNSLIASNVIIDPGNYDFYENGGTHFRGVDSYIMFPDSSNGVKVEDNLLRRTIDSVHFLGNSFSPAPGSPLIDGGSQDNRGIQTDLFHHQRLFGSQYDIGAIEYNPHFSGTNDATLSESDKLVLFPNPVTSSVQVKYHLVNPASVTLDIYNLSGNHFLHQVTEKQTKGDHLLRIDTKKFTPSIYLVVIKIEERVMQGRFVKLSE